MRGTMSRTVSVAFDSATGSYDLDGTVVSQLEALRQRVREAVYLRFGEWILARSAGLDRDLIIGHNINLALAAAAINEVIREEGGDEITGIHDVQYSVTRVSRTFNYSSRVTSIWGEFTMAEALNG